MALYWHGDDKLQCFQNVFRNHSLVEKNSQTKKCDHVSKNHTDMHG